MSVKPDDEASLWDAVVKGEVPRQAGEQLGIHPKRVAYLCKKWERQGRYDYGVTIDLGWALVS